MTDAGADGMGREEDDDDVVELLKQPGEREQSSLAVR
jgi:hypothetical protein